MNYMKNVAKMLGVELGEEFKVACKEGTCYEGTFYLSEQGVQKIEGGHRQYILNDLMTGDCKVKRLPEKTPWMPKDGEEYYFINTSKFPSNTHLPNINYKNYYGDNYDMLNLLTENHFKIREQALEAKDELIEKFEKIKKGELRI